MNIGFIGCGSIANFHADVLQYLQKDIIAAADPKQENLKKFQQKYNIINVYSSWLEMINNENLDAIWVTASWNVIDKILLDVLECEIPTFFEKPVALSVGKLEDAIVKYNDMLNKVQVGYNRRFYDFVPKIKNMLSEIEINSVELHIPESSAGITDENLITNIFLQNSSHVLDLMFFLLNEPKIEIEKIYRKYSNGGKIPKGYNAILLADNTVPIHLIANWESPSNFGIKFHSKDLLVELLPVEIATIYNGFEIIEPTEENPIRRYKPKIKEQYFIEGESAKFKPGFLKQAINFFDTCVDNKYENTQASNLESALMITRLCKEIM